MIHEKQCFLNFVIAQAEKPLSVGGGGFWLVTKITFNRKVVKMSQKDEPCDVANFQPSRYPHDVEPENDTNEAEKLFP